MSYYYLYNAIVAIPYGYSVYNQVPIKSVLSKLSVGSCEVVCEFSYFIDGLEVKKDKFLLTFKNYKVVNDVDISSKFLEGHGSIDQNPGYAIFSVYSPYNERIFKDRGILGNYAICFKSGNKSVFMDYSYRVGDPQIINQMSEWRRFIITYGVVDVDLYRNTSNSLIFINPYNKPIVITFSTSDNRDLKRIKIPPNHARYYALSDILQEGECCWNGNIQFTANNRVVSYIISHSFNDVNKITDAEHLDPFRSDPTHARYLQVLRQRIGDIFARFN